MPMVVVFGTVCMDRMHVVPLLPKKGGYVEISQTIEAVGGEAWNTSFALSRWGTPLRLCSNSIGCGHEAEKLRAMIEAVPSVRVLAPEYSHDCPVCDIFVTPDGVRTMFGRGFESLGQHCTVDAIDFSGASWFTADPNAGEQAEHAARLAAQAGLRRYLMDFGDEIEYLPDDIWQSSTDRVGHPHNLQANLTWVQRFADRHGCLAILSDAANGFVAAGPALAAHHFPPFPCDSVVDSTGAGDCFRAGMLHGLDQDWPLDHCLAYAAAASSLKCRSLGATAGIPSLEETNSHLAANKNLARDYASGVANG